MINILQPLTIGKKNFQSNLIQAPLAGVSCAPFRELVWQFGGVAYCCTEMLSAQNIANNCDRGPRYQTRFKGEGPLCWQLSGNQPEILARASECAITQGADLLDLNCGCPQPKIRKKGCGTKLLSDERKLSALVKSMQHTKDIPVTVKMRIDANHGEFCDISVAQMLEQSGADAIIVHGRHWTHDYQTPALLDPIAKIVAAVNIPLIGNGDISNAENLKSFFAKTGCAGFMIARASVGQPWIFQQINQALDGENFNAPNQNKIGQLFLKHAEGLMQLESERNAVLQCRRLGKYYARTLKNKVEFLKALYRTETYEELKNNIEQYF